MFSTSNNKKIWIQATMQQNTIVLSYDCPDGIYLKVTLFRSVGMRLDEHLLT